MSLFDRANPHGRRLGVAAFITFIVFCVELLGGILSGSLALVSDAGHMLTDLCALGISLLAFRFSTLPSNTKKTYGYHRLEILAAVLNGIILTGIVFYIVKEAFLRFSQPVALDTSTMLGVGGLGLAANLAVLHMLHDGRSNLNLRSAYFHVFGDALSSIAVVVSGLLIRWTGWYKLDSILSLAIAAFILGAAFIVFKEAGDILLEGAPGHVDVDELSKALEKINGVRRVHDVHVWSISSGRYAMSVHLILDRRFKADDERILGETGRLLREDYAIAHSTVQIEYEDCGLRC